MQWNDNQPRLGIDFGAIAEKVFQGKEPSGPPRMFRVCILKVPVDDPLPPAFAEFWRRVLSEGVANTVGNWDVLLFQMNLLGGGFTCVFTDSALRNDEPPVFKFSSLALETECYDLPNREPGDPRTEIEYQQLENKCLGYLRQAAQSDPAAGMLSRLRYQRTFSIQVCDFYREESSELSFD